MMTSIALIQGAGRGLGLEFSRVLSQRSNVKVIATARRPQDSEGLKSLGDRVDVRQIDVNDEGQIKDLSEYVSKEYGKVDFLLNSSGMLHPSGKETNAHNFRFVYNIQGLQVVERPAWPTLTSKASRRPSWSTPLVR